MKYKNTCDNCGTTYTVITEEDSEPAVFCPFCSEEQSERVEEDELNMGEDEYDE
jgi:predicted nucleic acid-binding Zn ribbon protein